MDTCCSLQTFLDAALALELTTLPPGDVRSAGFFHGRLGRLAAEALLTENGHFLVRESSSSSERQYVLSCRSTVSTEIGSQSPLPVALHFLIHEWPEKNEERKVQYAFDGDKFESIQALINYHVTMKAPVTSTSGAIISRPVERRRPLNQKQLEQCKNVISKFYTQLKFSSFQSDYQNRPNWSLSRLLKDVDVLLKVEETNLKETTSSLLDQNNLVDNNFAAFSSEYLRQLQSGISAISLEDSLLSSGGSSSSTDLKSYQSTLPIGDLLAYSSANLLATHLFKRDLLFFGLDFENFGSSESSSDISTTNTTLSTPPSPPLHCALELLCLPGIGRQFRRDAIVRHETLKYFVVLSILRSGQEAEKEEDTQAQVYLLRKWLQVTEKLLLSLGDHFAFGAIMAGLRHPAIASRERLWTALRSSGVASTEALLYDTIFSSQFKSLQGGALLEQNSRSMVLPFVVQLCHLMECSAIVGGRVMPLVQNENGTSLEVKTFW